MTKFALNYVYFHPREEMYEIPGHPVYSCQV